MTVPVVSTPNVAPPNSWPAILHQATIEVFSMMAGVEVAATTDAPQALVGVPAATVTGTVGIAGALSAIFSLRCSTGCAAKIASRMLGVSEADASRHQCDAIGEICNIVAGQFKAKIGLEDKCRLSVPIVVTGGNYQLHTASAARRLEILLLCESELMALALDIRE